MADITLSDDRLVRLANPERFAWRRWEGEFAFYDDLSGDTRLLEGWLGEIMALIPAEGCISVADLQAEAAKAAESSIDDAVREFVQQSLETLCRLGLVSESTP